MTGGDLPHLSAFIRPAALQTPRSVSTGFQHIARLSRALHVKVRTRKEGCCGPACASISLHVRDAQETFPGKPSSL